VKKQSRPRSGRDCCQAWWAPQSCCQKADWSFCEVEIILIGMNGGMIMQRNHLIPAF
jgi:hypothetical protein